MTDHSNNVYLHHIIDSIDLIFEYVDNISLSDFISNQMRIDAVIRNFEIMGEACNRLSPEFKEQHSEIDFRPATNMRNRLIHGYDEVNIDYVWDTIKDDLPTLKKEIEKILSSF